MTSSLIKHGFGAKWKWIHKPTYTLTARATRRPPSQVEVTWKGKIKAQFPDPNEYSMFMGDFSTCTGFVTFAMMITSRYIFSKFGWGVAAMITPTVLLVTGFVFFSLVIFAPQMAPLTAAMGLTPLMAAVLVGAAQNIFSKSSKYALFDPCKEMAYIPLDDETKSKGKAAIDVVCNPLGKSGGALIQQFLIVGFGSLAACTPYLGAILLVFSIIWLRAASSLNKQFVELTGEVLEVCTYPRAYPLIPLSPPHFYPASPGSRVQGRCSHAQSAGSPSAAATARQSNSTHLLLTPPPQRSPHSPDVHSPLR